MHQHTFLFDSIAHNMRQMRRYEKHVDYGGRGSVRLFNPRLGRFALGVLSTQHNANNTHTETHIMTTDTQSRKALPRVTVQKSTSQSWPHWCVYTAGLGGVCEWFKHRHQAEAAAERLRNKISSHE